MSNGSHLPRKSIRFSSPCSHIRNNRRYQFSKTLSPGFVVGMDNVQLRVVNYILYGNGKPIREIYNTSIQLVRTCLVLNCTPNQFD